MSAPLQRLRGAFLAGCLAGLASCSFLTSFDDSMLVENSYDRCQDNVDNDGDGLTDCDDPDCAPYSFCTEISPEACADGQDNDGDDLIDCKDPGCLALSRLGPDGGPGVCREQTPDLCSDETDNDGDGLVDCLDPDCRKVELCQETTGQACSDKKDNDGDQLVDCNDFDCYGKSTCCNGTAFVSGLFSLTYTQTAGQQCTNASCLGTDTKCCQSDYKKCCEDKTAECNEFNPLHWVAWGLPRPVQSKGTFLVNEPCKCDVSGIVSVEAVPLASGLKIVFDLKVPLPPAQTETICGGLTRTLIYTETQKQCSGNAPELLFGVCIEASPASTTPADGGIDGGPPDAMAKPDKEPTPDMDQGSEGGSAPDAGVPDAQASLDGSAAAGPTPYGLDAGSGSYVIWARFMVDGQVAEERMVTGASSFHATLSVSSKANLDLGVATDGGSVASRLVTMSAAGISHAVKSPLPATLKEALVLVYGHGTGASLSNLSITDPISKSRRCADPSAWIRHMARGEAVLASGALVSELEQPTVLWDPPAKNYLMYFMAKSKEGAQEIYRATSTEGLKWEICNDATSSEPLPILKGSTTFGQRVSSPSALYHLPTKTYHLWYSRQDDVGSSTMKSIAHATSKDGVTFKEANSPALGGTHVLGPDRPKGNADGGSTDGSSGPDSGTGAPAWDSGDVESPTVVWDGANRRFLMWYTGTQQGNTSRPAIGLASSKNGIVWDRETDRPVISPQLGSADMGCKDPAVVYHSERKQYLMWYTHLAFGQPLIMRYAAQAAKVTDWVSWTQSDIIATGSPGAFDERGILAPAVILEPGRIRLWYTGINRAGVRQIGYAENRGER